MKKKYSVMVLSCLVALFTVFVVMTPAHSQTNTTSPAALIPVDVVNPANLPGKFNQLQLGMSKDQVKSILGWPVTIQPKNGDNREWKYYLPGGVARLYINFQDNKIISIQQLTP